MRPTAERDFGGSKLVENGLLEIESCRRGTSSEGLPSGIA